ncbi:unnamed protein product [Clonostachys byssicola]|uniref:Uncharacterized protein n=1 Tax=Clonostachys byssicola TaxID=160290 RepID=A0A9N9UKQ1_9HYPO|nr:unnamed protein product [Clonostachys byssicola]
METNPSGSGPANGQHLAPFRLVGNGKGLEPFELTPEQEGQMRDGTTQVKPRRELMRWYFAQKLGALQDTMDHVWMCTTRQLWLNLLNKGHTRVSRDSILGEIDAKVWDILAEFFTADSPLLPEYPFGEHPAHDESAPMSQEYEKMREKMAVPLVPGGSRTCAPPIPPKDMEIKEFRDWIVEEGLWGIVTIDATNEYSTPLPPAVPRHKLRKGCSERVKALWEDSACFEWAKCPSVLLPGRFQVIVPHVPELFHLPQSHEVIRCIPQSRAIVRRQHYTGFYLHNRKTVVVDKYAIGPDLDDGDIRDIDQQTANDMKGLWQSILNWALMVWSGNVIRFEEWSEMTRQNIDPFINRHELVIYIDLIKASHEHNLATLDGLIKRTNSIKALFKASERSRETLGREVATILQNKQRSSADRENDMSELALKGQDCLPRFGTNSPFEQHLLNTMWVISQSNKEGAACNSVSGEQDMWPTVRRVTAVVLKRIVVQNIRKPMTIPNVESDNQA